MEKPNISSSSTATKSLEPTISCFLLLNAQGISPRATSSQKWKLPYLNETYIESSSYFVPFISITESWLKSYITDSQITLPNYYSVRSDRSSVSKGGSLLYIHKSIPIMNESKYDDGECEAAICTVGTTNVIIASIYRPPTASEKSFKKMFQGL